MVRQVKPHAFKLDNLNLNPRDLYDGSCSLTVTRSFGTCSQVLWRSKDNLEYRSLPSILLEIRALCCSLMVGKPVLSLRHSDNLRLWIWDLEEYFSRVQIINFCFGCCIFKCLFFESVFGILLVLSADDLWIYFTLLISINFWLYGTPPECRDSLTWFL